MLKLIQMLTSKKNQYKGLLPAKRRVISLADLEAAMTLHSIWHIMKEHIIKINN